MSARRESPRLLVSEVIQTSGMDCGPAALKSLLEGFRVPVSYGRLREACHTDVDGTSIDTLEEVALQLDLEVEQIMVPLDHVLLKEAAALPAIAVVRNPIGGAHFVVAWRCHGPLVQVMDPARGRLWLRPQAFLDQLFVHSTVVTATAWRDWAGSDAFLVALGGRLRTIGLSHRERESQIDAALSDSSWHGLAALDASARMIATLRSARALNRSDAAALLAALLSEAQEDVSAAAVPDHYWSVRAADSDGDGTEQVSLRGAVLVRARGRKPCPPTSVHEAAQATAGSSARSPELAAALAEPPLRPLRDVVGALRADGVLGPAVGGIAMAIAVAGVVFEAILLRSVLDIGALLRVPEQALGAGAALALFAAALLGLEVVLASAERRAGSHLEARLRIAFLDKIPRLADSYFQTRPVSDMLERSHSVHTLRALPQLGVRFLRVALELIVTTVAIAWLDPRAAGLALVAATAAAGIPLMGHSIVAERDLRVRTHAGALARFHLDALLGRTAIEAHGASATIEGEHERLLAEWAGASVALQRASVAIEGFQMLVGFGLAGWMLFGHFGGGDTGGMLLLVYWVLNLPALGYELALNAREYPAHRSTIVRLLEPLGAPGVRPSESHTPEACRDRGERSTSGVRIDARRVVIRAAGHLILQDIDLHVAPGSHVAIVGASGAGKSTLVGMLLGWHRPAAGDLLIDGEPLAGDRIEALRRDTAWVDPTVQIWNRSLLDNLLYGSDTTQPIGPVLEAAGLVPVIAKLPQGLATPLGEGGTLLSAGEAQRVRLGRAMLRRKSRLVILDEPFLGLERDRRRVLLARVRQRWAGSTLLYVTHDVAETRSFDRVLVLERGRIVEDGDPLLLAQTASSRYRRLLQAQDAVRARFSASAEWRRIRLDSGQIVQDHVDATFEQTA